MGGTSISSGLTAAENAVLTTFIQRYIDNIGIQMYLLEKLHLRMARAGVSPGDSPKTQLDYAFLSVERLYTSADDILDLDNAADAAPAIKFLADLAKQVDASIIPPSVGPSDRLVEKLLAEFHDRAQRPVSHEIRWVPIDD